jgi:hypothetical protein
VQTRILLVLDDSGCTAKDVGLWSWRHALIWGCAVAQSPGHWPFVADTRVQSWVTSTWDSWWTKWHWSWFFSEFFDFPLLIIVPKPLHTHLTASRGVCNTSEQPSHFHTLGRGPKLRASSLDPALVWTRSLRQYIFFYITPGKAAVLELNGKRWEC